ncbi:HD domain-containing protein [Polynucleobacter sp. JS-Safj-400b-B2]|uniref:HD domain-containing phosphohydrolase n=1 Tax=Polynucleobacter sp. JS-Safj-400b-B2 TaxID=2576921 RepID=UPI001C0CDD82|nr:HD domain-containing phosphohydrolase [Polynucleobacter sp. JS-Safj-400b-B2]MBU3626358.1 HD domain-containing protein [Polynucleobacter sp. JS-Safj-400b-B2]
MKEDSKSHSQLLQEIDDLRRKWLDAQQTLDAIRDGAVDALVVAGKSGERIFTLVNADHPYRLLLEEMSEGALTISADGLILFCNQRFAEMVKSPMSTIVGSGIYKWVDPENDKILEAFLKVGLPEKRRMELNLLNKDGEQVPIYLSVSKLSSGGEADIYCLVATDLTEEKQLQEMVSAKKTALAALQASTELEQSLEESIKSIAYAVESRDEYTAGHMKRVGQLAPAIARELGLSEDMIHGIELASTIHDVGKISIPVEILTKPGKLSNVEYMLIQTHAEAGYDIVKNIKFPWPIAQMIYQHHERMDGSGYPQGLKGDEILLGSRIIAVADVIEAMSTHRPYRFVLGIDAALDEIKQHRGTLYDAQAVDACIKLFKEKRFSFS